jgi:hypothetical protein
VGRLHDAMTSSARGAVDTLNRNVLATGHVRMAERQLLQDVPARQAEGIADQVGATLWVVVECVVVAKPHRLTEGRHQHIDGRAGQIAALGYRWHIRESVGAPVARRREVVSGLLDL